MEAKTIFLPALFSLLWAAIGVNRSGGGLMSKPGRTPLRPEADHEDPGMKLR